MTDHKAIAIFTGLKMMVGTQAKEACDAAISALQEREKRSKGCEFCDGTERSMMFRKGECVAMNDEVYVSGDAIIIDYGCKAYDTVKIGFCPMCGRPLKGEDNGKVD